MAALAAIGRIPLFCSLFAILWGQDQTPAQTPPSPGQPPAQGEKNENREKSTIPTSNTPSQTRGTSNDRLFFALPNFLTLENAANAPPLTAAQKFKVTARGTFDPIEFLWYGAQAGISQAENHNPTYGQGTEGYAKRFAVRVADGSVENFFTRAIYPSLLRQDPRYFQLGKGGFWRRATYSVSRIFITRGDSGDTEFNFSEILGSASGAGVSTFTYHPKDARNVKSALHVWGTQVGYDTLSYVAKEFWPDLRRLLRKSKSGHAAPQPAAAQPGHLP
jgi:hypothetical protein